LAEGKEEKSGSGREELVSFSSGGLRITGIVTLPENLAPGEKRPAFIALHGFGSSKSAENVRLPCRILNGMGYVTLRIDLRGCGDSEGERGRLIMAEHVANTRDALEFLSKHPAVGGQPIGVIGSSLGAAVGIYAAAIDGRFAAVVSSGGWGNGENKFRRQHATPEAWARFSAMLAEGKGYRERTGKPLMVPRFDIVPIPASAGRVKAADALEEFPWETAQSMFEFRPEEVVSRIAPRPLLLLHSSADPVTPREQSIALFERAGQPTDLHMFAEGSHYLLAQSNERVWRVVRDWLEKHFPVGSA
jgi:dipeptidyl aminopeptidase/acylaminoacyl peptidase